MCLLCVTFLDSLLKRYFAFISKLTKGCYKVLCVYPDVEGRLSRVTLRFSESCLVVKVTLRFSESCLVVKVTLRLSESCLDVKLINFLNCHHLPTCLPLLLTSSHVLMPFSVYLFLNCL